MADFLCAWRVGGGGGGGGRGGAFKFIFGHFRLLVEVEMGGHNTRPDYRVQRQRSS